MDGEKCCDVMDAIQLAADLEIPTTNDKYSLATSRTAYVT